MAQCGHLHNLVHAQTLRRFIRSTGRSKPFEHEKCLERHPFSRTSAALMVQHWKCQVERRAMRCVDDDGEAGS
jgi:hypothetical protein